LIFASPTEPHIPRKQRQLRGNPNIATKSYQVYLHPHPRTRRIFVTTNTQLYIEYTRSSKHNSRELVAPGYGQA
jgi:hypothetical protein